MRATESRSDAGTEFFASIRKTIDAYLAFKRSNPREIEMRTIDEIIAAAQKATEASLRAGIAAVKPGATLGDVGAAVQGVVEGEGFSVVRDFVGHGIGVHMHEDPQVPNFGEAGQGMRLKAGMVIAIEPMVNAGKPDVKVLDDGWTAVAADGSMSAHFEHTVAVTATGSRVLTE